MLCEIEQSSIIHNIGQDNLVQMCNYLSFLLFVCLEIMIDTFFFLEK